MLFSYYVLGISGIFNFSGILQKQLDYLYDLKLLTIF